MRDEWFAGNYNEAIKINEKLSNINNLLFKVDKSSKIRCSVGNV